MLILTALLFFLFPLYSTIPSDNMEMVAISATYPTHPILIGKSDNTLIHLEIQTQGSSNPLAVNALTINLDGTDATDDLQKLTVFYTGDSARFFPGQSFDMGKSGAAALTFQGNLRLKEGVNHLWVSCELKPTTPLDHRIRAICSDVLFSDGKHYLPSSR